MRNHESRYPREHKSRKREEETAREPIKNYARKHENEPMTAKETFHFLQISFLSFLVSEDAGGEAQERALRRDRKR